jgi:hypothetical protein
MPQAHGAVRGALEHVRNILEIKSGSATDIRWFFRIPLQKSLITLCSPAEISTVRGRRLPQSD